MTLRWVCLVFAISACGTPTTETAPAAEQGGMAGAAGAANLRPPLEIPEPPGVLGPSSVECAGTPAPEPAVVRACVLSAGCSPSPRLAALSDCIAKALPASSALPPCALGAQSCAEMDACLGTGFYADPCPEGDIGKACAGTKLIDCAATPRSYRDCAKLGATCSERSIEIDGELVDTADCVVDSPCPAAGDTYVCDGSRRVLCQGASLGEDCAARGLACADTPDGAVCMKNPADCSEPDSGRCDVTGSALYCAIDGTQWSFDCAQMGLVCEAAPQHNHGVRCVDPECSAADAAACFEECDGPMAHLCIGGRRYSIDCQSYGFRGCVLETWPDTGDRAGCGGPR
jgi:hypothetical protein